MGQVEKLMTERNIGDYDVAASYFASKNPKPTDDRGGGDGHYWNHTKTEEFEQISADPEEWARKQILASARADQERQRQMR